MKHQIVGSLIALMLTGCGIEVPDNIEFNVKQVGNRTYLINHEDGELFRVDGDVLVPIETRDATSSLDKYLRKSGGLTDDLSTVIETKFIDGQVFYRLFVYGKSETVETENGPITMKEDIDWFHDTIKNFKYDYITLQFRDSSEFLLNEKKVELSKTPRTRMPNADGTRFHYLYEGSFKIDKTLMSRVDSLGYSYSMSVKKPS